MAKTLKELEEERQVAANGLTNFASQNANYQAYQDALNKYNNRQAFSYDINSDALYQQYKDSYMKQGQLAMEDTIGKAASMTGGYGNSYATTAGAQAYNDYVGKLNETVPELYSLAYSRYQDEGNNLLQKATNYSNLADSDYSYLSNAYDVANTEYTNEYNNEIANYKYQLARANIDSDLSAITSEEDLATALDKLVEDQTITEEESQLLFNEYYAKISEANNIEGETDGKNFVAKLQSMLKAGTITKSQAKSYIFYYSPNIVSNKKTLQSYVDEMGWNNEE